MQTLHTLTPSAIPGRRAARGLAAAVGLAALLLAPAGSTWAIGGANGATLTKDSKVALSDVRWMEKAARMGAAEVAGAKLALAQSQRNDIRGFAKTMIEEYTKANEELKSLGERKGVMLPDAPDSAHTKLLQKLTLLNGPAFDREYMNRLGTRDHTNAAKLYEDGVTYLKDLDIKEYATRNLPQMRRRFDMVRDIKPVD